MPSFYHVSFAQITQSIFVCFLIKGNQTMLRIFMTMDPAVQMGIWPCSASLRIHQLVSLMIILTATNLVHLIVLMKCSIGVYFRCVMERWNSHTGVEASANHCNTFWIVTYVKTYGKKTIWVVAHLPCLSNVLFTLNIMHRATKIGYLHLLCFTTANVKMTTVTIWLFSTSFFFLFHFSM